MRKFAWLLALGVGCVLTSQSAAQQPPTPGPEFEPLKELVGTWEATMAGGAGKGTMTYKMDLGGLWLLGDFQGDFGGMKFSGKGADSYDAAKKKYVGIWIDSMQTSPMVMEGTYDKAKKIMTMTGTGPDQTGNPTKWKSVGHLKDKDNMDFKMYTVGADGKDMEAFSIVYKRKK